MSMQRTRGRRLIALFASMAVLVALLSVAPARAATGDSVRDWNANAVAALVNAPAAGIPGAGMTPPVSALHLAMVQGAVYDAVNAIEGGYEPYLAGLPGAPSTASQEAAVATAAHDVLVGLTNPSTTALLLSQATRDWLDVAYAASLAEIAPGDAKDDGIAIGAAAAAAMLAERADDGRYGTFTFTTGTEPGEWRPTSGVSDPFAWVARVDPFVIQSTSQFRTDGPNALTSAAYAEEFDEVKSLGSMTDSDRTPEQTAVAMFYTANPVELWNRTYRTIVEDQDLSLAEEARFFALVNVSGADAFINCWDDKAFWSFWRPVTAIRLAGDDGNGATEADPNWTPLVTTPPYPDHPSGYNCITGSLMHAAKAFFGTDRISFEVLNLASNVTREYDKLTATIKDTIDARIYLGIHFRTPDVQAAVLGKKVADWVDKHAFRRLG